jgi:tRNA pseudouridine38-40 synthase
VAYDGTPYNGFQVQVGKPTVQEELEKAIERITQQPTRVVAAGRTDAGVHATGQVIHFLSGWQNPPAALERALNAVLPDTIAVAELEHAKPGFHARYSATSRCYRYDILNNPTRSPIRHRFALHRSRLLDTEAMHAAMQSLIGTHDFRAFAGGEEPGASTVRNVTYATCRRSGDTVRIKVEANAFIRHMMRRIVGTALEIGEGRKPTEHMEQVLAAGNKALAGPTTPAKGLFLIRVTYPDTFAPKRTKEDQQT